MDNLWASNTPQKFWLLDPDPGTEEWTQAIKMAIPKLDLSLQVEDIGRVLLQSLGEAQYGEDHWQLSTTKRLYYELKPALPKFVIDMLKKFNAQVSGGPFLLDWPIEKRWADFQWEIVRQLSRITGQSTMKFQGFWPDGFRYAFVLTHDIEAGEGQAFVREVADLEESLGFRSSFNFVPERYELDVDLMQELRARGFEIGVHGLKHDGKLYSSEQIFKERAKYINRHLKEIDAVGFRSPLMHRHPEWLQALDIEYDLSFFDTDPYEPMPGGCMNIWPFMIGRFIELPYTLVQDSTLAFVLGEKTPQIWFDKVDFLEQYHGLALLNSHPDYLRQPEVWEIYVKFLETMKTRNNYWHALPKDVARWWRQRIETPPGHESPETKNGTINLENDQIIIDLI